MLRQGWPGFMEVSESAARYTSASESEETRYVVSGHKMVVLATGAEARYFLVPVQATT